MLNRRFSTLWLCVLVFNSGCAHCGCILVVLWLHSGTPASRSYMISRFSTLWLCVLAFNSGCAHCGCVCSRVLYTICIFYVVYKIQKLFDCSWSYIGGLVNWWLPVLNTGLT